MTIQRWAILIFVVILFTAPLLAADIVAAIIAAIQTAIASLQTFGSAVVPK